MPEPRLEFPATHLIDKASFEITEKRKAASWKAVCHASDSASGIGRYDLTDFEWRVIEPLLPNKPRRRAKRR